MCAEIVLKKLDAAPGEGSEKTVGVLGVVHPEVLSKYEISYPCSLVEIDIEAIM